MRIHKQSRSELNPPETPLQKFLHSLLYHFAYPLLKVHLKLWYGFSARYDFSFVTDFLNPSDVLAPTDVLDSAASDSIDTSKTTHVSNSMQLSYKKWTGWKARRELKKLRSSLVVCNHISLLDAAMVGVALWPLHLQILSLAENGQNKIYSPLVRAFGTVFVGDNLVDWRGMAEKQRKALEAGECILIFPEGELSPYATKLHPFCNGTFRLASFYKVPIICVTLVPTKKICLNRLLGRPGFTAYVGPVVKRDASLEKRAVIAKMQEITEEILAENLREATEKR